MSRRTLISLVLVALVALAARLVVPANITDPLFRRAPPIEAAIWAVALSLLVAVGLFMWATWPKAPTGRLLYLAGVSGLLSAAFFVPRTQVLGILVGLISVMFMIQAIAGYPKGTINPLLRALLRVMWVVLLVAGGVAILTVDPRPELCTNCPRPLLLVSEIPLLSTPLAVIANGSAVVAGIAAGVDLVLRWLRGSTPTRRALGPIVALTLVPVAALAVTLIRQFLTRPPVSFSTIAVVEGLLIMLFPIGFLWGELRTQLGIGEAADLMGGLSDQFQLGQVQERIREQLGDPSLEIGFWTNEANDYVDAEGRPLPINGESAVTELDRDGSRFVVVLHDEALKKETVQAVASLAGLALENERLHAEIKARLEEVRASRRRIVVAADEARHRVERDLHDGAQQRLVALGLTLELLEDDLDEQASEVAAQRLREARAEAKAAITELRDLTRGLHPAALTESGLGPATENLAARMSIPVRVEIPERRWAEPVETTAYYVISEALTNITRHAGAKSVTVEVPDDDEVLSITISDDGRGGADPATGTGLQGLADRLDAIGGELEIHSTEGEGTTLRASIPCG